MMYYSIRVSLYIIFLNGVTLYASEKVAMGKKHILPYVQKNVQPQARNNLPSLRHGWVDRADSNDADSMKTLAPVSRCLKRDQQSNINILYSHKSNSRMPLKSCSSYFLSWIRWNRVAAE